MMIPLLHFLALLAGAALGVTVSYAIGDFTGSILEISSVSAILIASIILDLVTNWRKDPDVVGPEDTKQEEFMVQSKGSGFGKVFLGIIWGTLTGLLIWFVLTFPKPIVYQERIVAPPVLPRLQAAQVDPDIQIVSYTVDTNVMFVDVRTPNSELRNQDVTVYRDFDTEPISLEYQWVEGLTKDAAPICLNLLIDKSGSMKDKMPQAIAASTGITRTLRLDKDLVRVIPYDDVVPPDMPWQTVADAIITIEGIEIDGDTATWDAIIASQKDIPCATVYTVVITDGDNTVNNSHEQQALDSINSPVTIVGIESARFSQAKITRFTDLCIESGKNCSHVSADVKELEKTLIGLSESFRATRIAIFLGAEMPNQVKIVFGQNDFSEVISLP